MKKDFKYIEENLSVPCENEKVWKLKRFDDKKNYS